LPGRPQSLRHHRYRTGRRWRDGLSRRTSATKLSSMRPPGIRATRIVVVLAGLAVAPTIAAAQQTTDAPDKVIPLDSVHVRVSPLGAGGVPLRRLPNGAQVVEPTAISGSGQLTIADALKGLVGVTAASQFGSELQPD